MGRPKGSKNKVVDELDSELAALPLDADLGKSAEQVLLENADPSIIERYSEAVLRVVWDVSYQIPGKFVVDAGFLTIEAAKEHADLMTKAYGLKGFRVGAEA